MPLVNYILATISLLCLPTSAYASGYHQSATILRYHVTVEIQNDQSIIEETYTARIDREDAISELNGFFFAKLNVVFFNLAKKKLFRLKSPRFLEPFRSRGYGVFFMV